MFNLFANKGGGAARSNNATTTSSSSSADMSNNYNTYQQPAAPAVRSRMLMQTNSSSIAPPPPASASAAISSSSIENPALYYGGSAVYSGSTAAAAASAATMAAAAAMTNRPNTSQRNWTETIIHTSGNINNNPTLRYPHINTVNSHDTVAALYSTTTAAAGSGTAPPPAANNVGTARPLTGAPVVPSAGHNGHHHHLTIQQHPQQAQQQQQPPPLEVSSASTLLSLPGALSLYTFLSAGAAPNVAATTHNVQMGDDGNNASSNDKNIVDEANQQHHTSAAAATAATGATTATTATTSADDNVLSAAVYNLLVLGQEQQQHNAQQQQAQRRTKSSKKRDKGSPRVALAVSAIAGDRRKKRQKKNREVGTAKNTKSSGEASSSPRSSSPRPKAKKNVGRETSDSAGAVSAAAAADAVADVDVLSSSHHSRVIETEPMKTHVCRQLVEAMVLLSEQDEGLTIAYKRAQERCPELVAQETDPVKWLRATSFNPFTCCVRLCAYWRLRVRAYGEDRAYRPLLDLSGDTGALLQHDIRTFDSLGFVYLHRLMGVVSAAAAAATSSGSDNASINDRGSDHGGPSSDRRVLFVDQTKSTSDHCLFAHERLIFWLMHLLMVESDDGAIDEDDQGQHHPLIVCLVRCTADAQRYFDTAHLFTELMERGLRSTQVPTVHVLCRIDTDHPHGSNTHRTNASDAVPSMLQHMGKGLSDHVVFHMLPAGSSVAETVTQLTGLSPTMIPTGFDGSLLLQSAEGTGCSRLMWHAQRSPAKPVLGVAQQQEGENTVQRHNHEKSLQQADYAGLAHNALTRCTEDPCPHDSSFSVLHQEENPAPTDAYDPLNLLAAAALVQEEKAKDVAATVDGPTTTDKRAIVVEEAAALRHLEDAITMIPDEERRHYDEARRRAPELVATESNPGRFWRQNGYNIFVTAKRIVFYWALRVQIFGNERAFLPMNLTGEGALTKKDMASFDCGALSVLPNLEDGRGAFLLDKSKQRDCDCEHDMRAVFFILQLMSQNDANLSNGCFMVIQISGFKGASLQTSYSSMIENLYAHTLPMQRPELHMVFCPPSPSNGSGTSFLEKLVPFALKDVGPQISKDAVIHVADSPEEAFAGLSQHGCLREGLPLPLGGTLDDSYNWKWQEQYGRCVRKPPPPVVTDKPVVTGRRAPVSAGSKQLVTKRKVQASARKGRRTGKKPGRRSADAISLGNTLPQHMVPKEEPLASADNAAVVSLSSEDEKERVRYREPLEVALMQVPFCEKVSYVEALSRLGMGLWNESDPLAYLRCEAYNANAAIRRLAVYWEQRRTCFGDSAFLPLRVSSPCDGALSYDDLATVCTGVLSTRSLDGASGHNSIVFDRSKLMVDQVMPSMATLLRCCFYVLSVLAENKESQTKGGVFAFVVSGTQLGAVKDELYFVDQLFRLLETGAIPIVLDTVHLLFCIPDPIMLQAFVTGAVEVVGRYPSIGQRTRIYAHQTPDPFPNELAAHSFGREHLPETIGGTWDSNAFNGWFRHRVVVDESRYAVPTTRPGGRPNLAVPATSPSLSLSLKLPGKKGKSSTSLVPDLSQNAETTAASQAELKKVQKRKMDALYNRRSRERRRIEVEGLKEQCEDWKVKNAALQEDNQRLEQVLERALSTLGVRAADATTRKL